MQMSLIPLIVLVFLAASCGSNIEKEPQTIYVVVNNSTNGATNSQNTSNQTTPSAGNSDPKPVNATPNNEPIPVNNEPIPVNNEPVQVNNEACNNAADLEIVSSTDMPIVSRDCALECLSVGDSRTCTADCVSETSGASEQCSLCVADLTQCGVQFCFELCVEDPYLPECLACLDAKCEDDFIACSGIPSR